MGRRGNGGRGGGELLSGLNPCILGMAVGGERAILISPALVNNSAPGLYPTGCWLFGTIKIVAKRLVEGNEVEDTQENEKAQDSSQNELKPRGLPDGLKSTEESNRPVSSEAS